jgi:uncharacterized protein (UPF0305 family)
MTEQVKKLIDELPKMHKHDVECNGSFVTYYIMDDVIALVEKLTGKGKNKDLSFLREMKEKTEKLLHDRYDITIVESLDGMIGDWIHELNNKTHENRKSKRHY